MRTVCIERGVGVNLLWLEDGVGDGQAGRRVEGVQRTRVGSMGRATE